MYDLLTYSADNILLFTWLNDFKYCDVTVKI